MSFSRSFSVNSGNDTEGISPSTSLCAACQELVFGVSDRLARLMPRRSTTRQSTHSLTPCPRFGRAYVKYVDLLRIAARYIFPDYHLIIGRIEMSVTSAVRERQRALTMTDATSSGCSRSSGR